MQTDYEISMMKRALKLALKARELSEVPVGAVIAKDGKIVASAYNLRETNNDPTAHAEIIAIKRAAKKLARWNLSDCELFVTLEPCAMCAGAIVYSRLKRVVFGAYDKRFGCCGSVMNLACDERLNHRAEVIGGVMEEECLKPVQQFFQSLRLKP